MHKKMYRLFQCAMAGVVIAFVSALLQANAQGVGPDPSLADPQKFTSNDGAFLYRATCQGCHMADGKGASGAGTYPSLVSNPRLQAAYYPLFMVTKGQRAMPGFSRTMTDEQIAAVVNYVRSNFGNQYTDIVKPEQVESLRK